MGEKNWTNEQHQAITERGKNILVSAGAGSGKTAVMVERITRLILEEHIPVSGMLIATFTDAAATEMRERLRKTLKERLNAASDQEWIRKQLDDLHNAQIGTFHSFAQRVIREFFYLIDIEPGMRVIDQAEDEVLKEEALQELFTSEYEENRDDFRNFMDSYSGDKDDSEARDMILSLYKKLETIPDGLNVFDEKICDLELDAEGFKRTKAYAELIRQCRRNIDEALQIARRAEGLLNDYKLDRMAGIITKDSVAINELKGIYDTDELVKAVQSIPFETLGANTKDEKEAYSLIKDTVVALHDGYKNKIKGIKKTCYTDLETMTKVMQMEVPYAHTLSRLLWRFDQIFRDIKTEHKGIDYSDMEHYAYEILGHKEAADYYRNLFRYIFIDEYQDTNFMQETIASLVARPDNMFMVGDIKQSIYHFRLADPEIFQNKYDQYKKEMQEAGSGASSIKIDLNMNYRSRPDVIREINNIFRPLMEGYDEDAELKCGIGAGEHALPEPRTYLVDRVPADKADVADNTGKEAADNGNRNPADNDDADAELTDIKKEELEARQAVQIIREILGKEYTDSETKKTKKVDYRDIVILMRSFKRSAEGFRSVFHEAGIPLYVEDREGYFDTIEINVALALLRVIDNKRQDIPFIALLRSEIFGFTCVELALIRKLHRYGSYVEAAENAASGGPDIPEHLSLKCRHVFDEIKKWQAYAVTLPLADMIWRILNETGYYVITGTYPNGASRQANLRLLADRARDYSEHTFGSLYGFIKYVDTLKTNKVDMPQATLFSENENVVRIMTIHKSKGLEFPVVILAGMDNEPKKNSKKGVVFDRELGLGLTAKDPVRHLYENSIVQKVITEKEEKAKSDELRRVYYVAVTRAREAFYLLGATDYNKVMNNLEAENYSDSTFLGMSRYLPEVVYVPGEELLAKPLALPDSESEKQDQSDSAEQDQEGSQSRSGQKHTISADEVSARLGYEYPFTAARDLAAKTSVTGLNKAKMRAAVVTGPGEEAADTGRLNKPDIPGMSDEYENAPAPEFMREGKKITAAKTGTVYHKLMEKLDFAEAGSEGYTYIAGKAAELVADGLFTEEEIKTVDLRKISNFFETGLGKRCIAASKASMLHKEQTFESRISIAGENVLVQGVIDCYFEEEDGVVLIDYKTNRIDRSKSLDEEEARIREMYQTQLDMYADAIGKATGLHVKEKYLYLFAADDAVPVN